LGRSCSAAFMRVDCPSAGARTWQANRNWAARHQRRLGQQRLRRRASWPVAPSMLHGVADNKWRALKGRRIPIVVETRGRPPLQLRGLYLDLRINFSGGELVRLGPPRLISPYQALSVYAAQDLAARAFLPINLFLLSERLVALSLRAPLIRRDPRSATERLNRKLSAQARRGAAQYRRGSLGGRFAKKAIVAKRVRGRCFECRGFS
jgi:hypothetical protein